jgi:hypothetical protein
MPCQQPTATIAIAAEARKIRWTRSWRLYQLRLRRTPPPFARSFRRHSPQLAVPGSQAENSDIWNCTSMSKLLAPRTYSQMVEGEKLNKSETNLLLVSLTIRITYTAKLCKS